MPDICPERFGSPLPDNGTCGSQSDGFAIHNLSSLILLASRLAFLDEKMSVTDYHDITKLFRLIPIC